MLKVSAFYLKKQKSFISGKKNLSRCQYQNKKALFTDPIFSEGFDLKVRKSQNEIVLSSNTSKNQCFLL